LRQFALSECEKALPVPAGESAVLAGLEPDAPRPVLGDPVEFGEKGAERTPVDRAVRALQPLEISVFAIE
jgi:hypothetical protein